VERIADEKKNKSGAASYDRHLHSQGFVSSFFLSLYFID
jgi:hypothetical protein